MRPAAVLATWDHQADPNHPVFKISDFGISKDMYEVMRDFRISPQRKVKVMWDRRRYGKQSCYFPVSKHSTRHSVEFFRCPGDRRNNMTTFENPQYIPKLV
jgi:hypothetical protein